MENFYLLGSDRRFDILEQYLREDGFWVFRKEEEGKKGIYLLSLGAKKKEVIDLLQKAAEGSTFFLGRAEEEVRDIAKQKSIDLHCLLEEEIYLEKNSATTAEGTLAEVIKNTDRLLSQQCILICGYGNCGRALARLFWLCGSEVWIYSHEGSMERARRDGFNIYRAPGKKLGMFDVILNTVPDPIFTDEWLGKIRRDCKIFQIASGLSGMDPEAAKAASLSFYPLPSLPGKYAPETEAETIYTLLKRFFINLESE